MFKSLNKPGHRICDPDKYVFLLCLLFGMGAIHEMDRGVGKTGTFEQIQRRSESSS